jgi:hypothetical protein
MAVTDARNIRRCRNTAGHSIRIPALIAVILISRFRRCHRFLHIEQRIAKSAEK